MTPKAFDLLVQLAAKAPRVVPKAELHARLWPDTFVSEATLVGLVKELRRAFRSHGASAAFVRTAHGVGYALDASVEIVGVPPTTVRHWIVAGERHFLLHDGDNVIGRDAAAEVSLDAASVSRRHARVSVDGSKASLEDLASKNGTTIGGQPITGPVLLEDGVRIELGTVSIIYRTSSSATSTVTVARRS